MIVTVTVFVDSRGCDLVVTVIATGLSSSLQTISKPSRQVNMLNERKPLPLSDAARQMLENPPKVEKIKKNTKIVILMLKKKPKRKMLWLLKQDY